MEGVRASKDEQGATVEEAKGAGCLGCLQPLILALPSFLLIRLIWPSTTAGVVLLLVGALVALLGFAMSFALSNRDKWWGWLLALGTLSIGLGMIAAGIEALL